MSLDDLYSEYTSIRYEPTPTITAFFRANSLALSNARTFENKDALERYTVLVTGYMNILLDTGMYNQAADYGEIYRQNVDGYIDKNHSDYVNSEGYQYAQYLLGIASYRLRDYRKSVEIFEHLLEQVPQNDSYRIWLESAQSYNQLWISNRVQITSGVILVLLLIFKHQLRNYELAFVLESLCLLCLLSFGLYDGYLKRNLRRKK